MNGNEMAEKIETKVKIKPLFYSAKLIDGIFLLTLFISAGYITEILNCRFQKLALSNIYMKHLLSFLILYFLNSSFIVGDKHPTTKLINSVVLYIAFNNIPSLSNLLGVADVYSNFSKLSCDPNAYFCRPPFIQFLYFYLSKFIDIDLIIFIQIFLIIFATLLIRVNLINLKINIWIVNILCLSLIINPKILKYSLSTMEEAFYLPCLLIIISLLLIIKQLF